MSVFPDDFIETIPSDQWESVALVARTFFNWWALNELPEGQALKNVPDAPLLLAHDDVVEAGALLAALSKSRSIGLRVPEMENGHANNVRNVYGAFANARSHSQVQIDRRHAQETFEKASSMFEEKFLKNPLFEFNDDEIERIQSLLNNLREAIQAANGIDGIDRHRLLRRVERVQKELNKTMADLDRFWGLVGDTIAAAGKMADEAQPIVSIVREVMDIVWDVQSRCYQLPPGVVMAFPLLMQGN